MQHANSEEPGLLRRALAGALATLLTFSTAPVAWASPQGEQVVHGSASFVRDGALTQITAANNTIIQYQSFDVAAGETVRFVQPDAASRVLNRIGDLHPTQIDGALLANGRVYLVNPAGVYFGNQAVVDVGALYAAAGALSDADFLARRDRFTQLGGSVLNLGSIRGDVVALLGREVANRGQISAPGGLIALVAGDEVVLVPLGERVHVRVSGGGASAAGVLNAGALDAAGGEVQLAAGDFYSLAIQQRDTGRVRAADVTLEGHGGGAVQVAGEIDATGETGGNVAILGEHVSVTNARIDASGASAGGTILVGGDYQGGNGVRSALTTTVARDAELRADALASGDGGKVIVWADGDTRFSGGVSARGGAAGGDGGFVETSGKQNLAFDGRVDVGAPQGRSGTLLLDPRDINLVDASPSADDGQVGPGDGTVNRADGGAATDFTISKTALEAVTGNILLEASRDISVQGIATLNLANQTAGETITFDADNDITIAAPITTGGGSLILQADSDGAGGGDVSISAAITTNGGNFQSDHDTFTLSAAGSIAAGAGDVSITGPGAVDIAGAISGDQLTIDGGSTVALPALATLGSLDVIGVGGITLNGDITTSGAQRYQSAVVIAGDRTLASTGGGDVAFDGTLNSDAGANRDLTVNTSGATTFSGAVGGVDELDVLTTDDAGSVDLAANVTTVGAQTYRDDTLSLSAALTDSGAGITLGDEATDALTVSGNASVNVSGAATGFDLGADTTLAGNLTLDAGANALTVSGTVDDDGVGGTSSDLMLNSSGATTVGGVIGGASALESVTSDDAGSLALNANVTTTGGQTYNDTAIALGAVTLSDTGAGSLALGNAAADALSVTGNATVSNTGGGALDLNATTTLGADLTLSAGSGGLTIAAAIDDDGFAGTSSDLALDGTGTTTIATAIGATNAIESLTSNDGGTVNVNAAVSTTAGQTYNDTTINLAASLITDSGGGDIAIGNAASDTVNFLAAGPISIDTSASGGDIALNASAVLASDLTLNAGAGNVTVGGNLNDDASALSSSNLVLNSAGATTLTGNLGGANRLESVTTNAAGSLSVAGSVRTSAGQFYNESAPSFGGAGAITVGDTSASGVQIASGALTIAGDTTISTAGGVAAINLTQTTTLAGNLTLDAGANALTVSGAVDDDGVGATSSDLVLTSSGATTLSGVVGGASALGSVTSDDGGSLALSANVTTTGGQAYNDAAIALAAVALSDTGAGTLALGNAGTDTLAVNGAATLANSGGGTLDLNAATTLAAGLTLNGGANAVTLDGTIDGAHALALNGTGAVAINAAIGGTTRLTSLTSDDGGSASINAAVDTAGSQSWNDSAIQLGANLSDTGAGGIALGNAGSDALQLTAASTVSTAAGAGDVALNAATSLAGNDLTLSTGANDLQLAGTTNGAGALALNSTGTVNVTGAIGGATAVTSVASDDGGTLALNANVTTTGGQTYDDSAIALGAATLSDTGSGSLALGNAATDTLSVSGAATLSNSGGGTLDLNTTTTLGAGLTVNGGANAVTLDGTIDGAQALALNGSGTVAINAAIGGTTALASVTSDDGGTADVNAAVRTAGSQSWNDSTIDLAANLSDSGAGGIALGNAASDALDVTALSAVSTSAGPLALNATTTLASDFSLSAGANPFTLGVAVDDDGIAATSGDFTISASTLTLAANIGQTNALDSLTLVPTDAIEFIGASSIRTSGDLAFNPGGRGPAANATVYKKNGALTLTSTGGSVSFGQGEKLTVAGDLTIDAANQILIGDLNAVDVSLTAPGGIVLVGRPPGSTSNGDPDVGADWMANSLALATPSLSAVGQLFVKVGLPFPPGGVLPAPFVVLAAFDTPSIGITPIDLLDPVTQVALDLTPGGPAPGSQRPPHNPVAVLLQRPSGGVNVAAASERPLRDSEVSAFLSCDPEDFECQAEAVGEARANSAQAQELRAAFDDLFGPATPSGAAPKVAAEQNPQKAALAGAVEAYRAQTGQAPSGVAFRQFCQSNADQADALRVLEDLRELFTSAREFGMTGEGMGNFKQQTLQEVAPEGIAMDALDAAVEAGALNP